MTTLCDFLVFLFTLILLHFNKPTNGLDQTKFNTNTANINLLLSESGRDPYNGAKPGGFPSLLQAPNNNAQNGNGQSPSRVNDLVNFYNNQGQATNAPSKPFSYSSAVSGARPATSVQGVNVNTETTSTVVSTHNQKENTPGHIQGSPNVGSNHNRHPNPTAAPKIPQTATINSKPTRLTFSDIVSGGNRSPSPAFNINHSPLSPAVQAPAKPNTRPTFSTIASGGSSMPISPSPSGKPTNAPVLPSAIAGNNRRQGNSPASNNAPSDVELQSLSEELLRKDTNNAAKQITINFQEKTTSQSKDDKAPLPLFTIPASVYIIPTIQSFLPLLDNYERDTLVNEYVTPQERNEENAFMDDIMQTQVIRHLMTFLKDKGYVTPDPRQQRDFLKQLWFNLYSRGRGKISSSGFEHVFVSELKNGEVSGLHNWLYFAKEESANRANYLGYLKYEQLGDKGTVMKLHFNQQGTDKPVDSMFVGTSPELEIALYSLCFVTRADQNCPLKLGGKNVNIVTHTFRYRSKNMIGSAYPQI